MCSIQGFPSFAGLTLVVDNARSHQAPTVITATTTASSQQPKTKPTGSPSMCRWESCPANKQCQRTASPKPPSRSRDSPLRLPSRTWSSDGTTTTKRTIRMEEMVHKLPSLELWTRSTTCSTGAACTRSTHTCARKISTSPCTSRRRRRTTDANKRRPRSPTLA
ncbi:hypothetical protein SEMRO_192_G082490.1 [Seminavis robusta]|uniref:Uncharacterized protein n=1 Tax=Seminavis robusta TaxID=568900 RepID=A0A9N8DPF0_9STRA|nr:hypothetical protein SEMRO_192_G082490.1 [Seminavis robusta]|eukprot:Sro192_g082490.1 n/a (164) ;mRNA; r:44933-45424